MRRIAFTTLSFALAVACTPADDTLPPAADQLVEVVARGMTFEAPDSISSGWTTFRFRNESELVHFALIEQLPPGQGIASQQAEIAPVFQEGLDLLLRGAVDSAMRRFGALPSWFGEVVFMGGPGLTSPGLTSEATVYLEPGTYLLECYVKTAGTFHSYNPDPAIYGMVHELTVTGDTSAAAEPVATLRITIDTAAGITVSGDPAAGEHTVAVTFTDQTVHENFVGHDVHLARLPAGLRVETLEQWMDWRQPGGLETPTPTAFLGGLNEMPAGSTGYFTVVLDPGEYAWIAEVAGSSAKGMIRQFTVP